MTYAIPNLLERPANEPVLSYVPGSAERAALKAAITDLSSREIEIPLIIGGREVRTGSLGECRMPHDHGHRLGVYHQASAAEVRAAIAAAAAARIEWAAAAPERRLGVFLRAADFLAGPHRARLNAATMLGQSKNVHQAEIDSACELVDFFRYNAHYATRISQEQPFSPPGAVNRMDYRPLEGFVLAITPFNFTSIAGNLPTAPAMLGNTVVWKPASSAVYSGYFIMKLLEEAGLPPGVINFVPGPGAVVGDTALDDPALAGVHFTGSTAVFQSIWRRIGGQIERYRSYPRLVGETGGKDFVFMHSSAPVTEAATALVRGAFEYQGQKCSAASRAYVPADRWDELRDALVAEVGSIRMGPPEDFANFMNAVIDRGAYRSIMAHLDYVRGQADAEILVGGRGDDSTGYFIEPTVVLAKTPDFRTMREEIFGPVLTVYVYDPARYQETLELCDRTGPYALTGAILARDRAAIARAEKVLVNAAGNLYINDKPTAAVVGQQPFGGGRASGTNDKAGSIFNMMRWASARCIKETLVPPTDYRYPFMKES
jgi:1-pyrroline-5-carboxylate dehydrogenase